MSDWPKGRGPKPEDWSDEEKVREVFGFWVSAVARHQSIWSGPDDSPVVLAVVEEMLDAAVEVARAKGYAIQWKEEEG